MRRGALPASLRAVVFFLLAGVAASTPFISDGALGSHGSTGRGLLQAKQSCPVSFEFMNYTVITSQCKGPQWSAKLCCAAFKDFACPYFEQLNELTNDCASTMFSYINLHGRYPPGLFSALCKDSKRGLECTVDQRKAVSVASAATVAHRVLPLVVVLLSLLTFLFI